MIVPYLMGAALLAVTPSPPPAPAPGRVHVVSLASEAAAFWAGAAAKPIDAQVALWNRLIEQPHAALYTQVVWSAAGASPAARDRILRAHLKRSAAIASELPQRFAEFADLAQHQVGRFRERFPDLPADLPIYALLAPTFDAKGAVLADPEPRIILAFAIDTVALAHDDLDIVFPHELFHAYHASVSGFRNDGVMPGVDLLTPLWAEGLATYASSLFQPDSVRDGALLLQSDLGEVPPSRLAPLARAFLAEATSPAIDPRHPEVFAHWFMGGTAGATPSRPNRSAYLLGLQVARRLARKATVGEMAHWSVSEARPRVLAALKAIAEGT